MKPWHFQPPFPGFRIMFRLGGQGQYDDPSHPRPRPHPIILRQRSSFDRFRVEYGWMLLP
jgi:hypothetical protein